MDNQQQQHTSNDHYDEEEEAKKPAAIEKAGQQEEAAKAKPTGNDGSSNEENDAVLDSATAMLSLEKASMSFDGDNNVGGAGDDNANDKQSTAEAPPKAATTQEQTKTDSSSKTAAAGGDSGNTTTETEAATTPVLVRGEAVPPLSKESYIPYLTENNNQRLKKAYVHCLFEDIPEELHDLASERWKDGKHLVQTFYAYSRTSGRRTRAKLQIPPCLLFSAKTLLDRLTVINFWLSNTREHQLQMTRDRDNGLLKYYMRLQDTRENVFRMAFYEGNPLQQKKKAEQQRKAAAALTNMNGVISDEHYNNTMNSMNMNFFQPPIVERNVHEKRVVMADETSTCLDYMLRTNILCIPCDQFRQRFLPPPHRTFVDVWPLYKARRKEIVANKAINKDEQYTCQQLFDITKHVGRGAGHKKRNALKFIEEHRVVQKSQSLIDYERKRLAKPCFGFSGDSVRAVILQASEQANRLAVLKDDVIPESFPLPDCYHNRAGFDNVIVRKEERIVKVPTRKRKRKSAARKDNEEVESEDAAERQAEETEEEKDDASSEKADTAKPAEAGPSKYHYVIRAKDCSGIVDTPKGNKHCKCCNEASALIRAVARDAGQRLNLTKGAALTKLDVAKLITSPELIESTIRMLRKQREKDLKMCRKELQRLRDRSGIQKQVRRKAAPKVAAAAAVEEPETFVEDQQQQEHHPHYDVPPVNGYRRYGYQEVDQELHYATVDDSDDQGEEMHEYRQPRALPQGVPVAAKRPRHQY